MGSSDGSIRGSELKVGITGSTIRRPVKKLYPLVPNDVDDNPIDADEIPIDADKIPIDANDIIDANEKPFDPIPIDANDIVDANEKPKISNTHTNHGRYRGRRAPRTAAIIGEIRRKFDNN